MVNKCPHCRLVPVDPEPSEDDLTIIKRLTEAGKILVIEVIDHIIITKNGFFSFKEKGLI